MLPSSESEKPHARLFTDRVHGDVGSSHVHVTGRMQFAMRMLALDRGTAEVVTAFRSSQIASILLKGPAMARWLYTDGMARGYADIDLLIPEERFEDAESVLEGLGFTRHPLETIQGDWERYSHTWNRQEANIDVDLHRTLVGVGVRPAELWDVLSRRVEPMSVGGIDVDVLQPGARALVLALHTAKDGPRIGKARHDLGHAVARLPEDVWRDTVEVAEQVGAVGALGAGLRLVVPSGVELAEALGLTAEAPPDVAIRAHEGAPPLAVGIGWLLSTPGRRGKLRLVARKLVPPPEYLRAWTPLARRGRLGLAAAYVWRPFWVLWHAGPALRAWLRVKNRSSR
jgi:putative nucleotidyltransferase-like protein